MLLEFLATTLLPALVPAAVDGIKSGIGMLTGNKAAAPQTFTDVIELAKLDIEKLKVLAELDKVQGTISQWVADLRASARYIAVFVILLGYGALATVDAVWQPVTSGVLDQWAMLAQSAVFFLLGDRVWMGIKGQAKK